jgi:VWFA-related protein/TonB family protein
LPSGTVVLDEAPPAAPVQKAVPVSTPAESSAGEEVGAEDVVRISSNLVTVPASVIDSQGRAVTDLKLEDFELRVDGQPRPISELHFSDTPVRIVLLFDNSMSLIAGREFEKQAAVKFFRQVLRPIDHAAVYSIYTYPVLAQPFTNNLQTLVRTIERFPKPEDGTTSLFDTVAEAAAYLRPYPERKVIIIVSDGADTTSSLDFDSTLRRVQAADCQVYAIQTGQHTESANLYDLAAQRRLNAFAEQTGGALYIPRAMPDLDFAFTQIARDLSQQYILSYYPTDERRDNLFRIISVRVATRPSMRVRARRGYYPRRPNERVSFNMNAPAMSAQPSNMGSALQPTTPSQTTEVMTLASNIKAPEKQNDIPVRSRGRGPSDSGEETDVGNNVETTSRMAEPVVQRNERVAKTGEPEPEQKPTPKPVSNSAPSASQPTAIVSRNTQPAPSPTPSATPVPAAKPTVSGGVLNGRAVSLPKPQYPPNARSMRAAGNVTVEVLLDEGGKVISARAVDGHPLLKPAAVAAARLATFTPTILSGQPVRVVGAITYRFTLNP